MANQNLFNTLKDVCDFAALETDMQEILNAVNKDAEETPADLDAQDIVDCGWKLVWNEGDELVLQLNDWILTYPTLEFRFIQINKGEPVYFRGLIKNKSELKLIMQRINIK